MTKKVVKTRTGDILIGQILDKKDPQIKGMMSGFFSTMNANEGIYLKRETHISFLAEDEIETIRDAHPWEREQLVTE